MSIKNKTVIFLQRTFTSSVYTHAGRTKSLDTDIFAPLRSAKNAGQPNRWISS